MDYEILKYDIINNLDKYWDWISNSKKIIIENKEINFTTFFTENKIEKIFFQTFAFIGKAGTEKNLLNKIKYEIIKHIIFGIKIKINRIISLNGFYTIYNKKPDFEKDKILLYIKEPLNFSYNIEDNNLKLQTKISWSFYVNDFFLLNYDPIGFLGAYEFEDLKH